MTNLLSVSVIMSFIRPPECICNIEELTIDFFNLWLEAFDDYTILNHPDADDNKKRTLFLAVAGLEVRRLVSGLNVTDKSCEALITAIRNHLKPVKNTLIARHSFFNAIQENNENINAYLVRLKQLASHCDFLDCTEENFQNQMIRDQLVRGLKDQKIREKVLASNEHVLSNIENLVLSMQQASLDNDLMSNSKSVLWLQQTSKTPKSRSSSGTRNSVVKCYSCNRLGHFAKDCFKNHKCKSCGKIGHFETHCKKSVSKTKKFLSHVTNCNTNTNLRTAYALVDNKQCQFLIDTGASISILSEKFVQNNGLINRCTLCEIDARLANNSMFKITKQINSEVRILSKVLNHCFYVCDSFHDGILGIDI